MTLRLADHVDLPELLRMSKLFKKNSPYADLPEDNEEILSTIKALLEDKQYSVVIVDPTSTGLCGVCAATSAKFMWNRDRHSAEIIWWVDPGYRGTGRQLKAAYEYWAKNVIGCTHSHMAAFDDRVGKFYEKDNYRRTETSYLKEL